MSTVRQNNSRQNRIIDPILTRYALGFSNPEFIGQKLMPAARVNSRGVKVVEFGKESFRLVNARRAPGSKKSRVRYGYGSRTVNLVQEALEGVVTEEDMEDASQVPEIDLAMGSIDLVNEHLMTNLEVQIAEQVQNPLNYAPDSQTTLSSGDRWTSDTSDPLEQFLDYREVVRRKIGRYPNVCQITSPILNALKVHPKIREQYKHTTAQSITTEMLANLFEVDEFIVGKALFIEENAPEDAIAEDIWKDSLTLAYVPKGNNYRVPSFGYTYTYKGQMKVYKPYWDDTCDSWIYPTKYERAPELTGADAGFLVTDIL